MHHMSQFRIYYEDTDAEGIVYYANYLKFIERGRSDWLREAEIDQNDLHRDHGIYFVVRRVVADYLGSAKLNDVITVTTAMGDFGNSRFTLHQTVTRDGETLFTAEVTLVTLGPGARPVRIPADVRRMLESVA